MAIIKTGPRKWNLTGKHAAIAAPFFFLFMGLLIAGAGLAIYLVVTGLAGLTGVHPVPVALIWLVLTVSLTVDGQRKALLPEKAVTGVNFLSLLGALYHYYPAKEWQYYVLLVMLAIAIVGFVKRQLKKAPSGTAS